jgi:HAD superfamily hydrolase (TIGR01509 family)
MRPKVVVFDLGKVLVDFDYSIATRKLAELSRVSHAEMGRIIDQSPLLVEFETGAIKTDRFFRAVCDATGFCGDQEQFSALFANIFSPIDPMIELHAELRRADVPTYVFSNTNDIAVRHIRNRFPFFSNFTGYILSYEHGAMKPEARIYQVVEKTTGVNGAEILYLDDRIENIETARHRGWQVIHHQAPEDTIATIRKLGLL